jgi:hypothetical protein
MMSWSIAKTSVSAFCFASLCAHACFAQQPTEKQPKGEQGQIVPSVEDLESSGKPARKIRAEHRDQLIPKMIRAFPTSDPSAILQPNGNASDLRQLRKERCFYAMEECLARFLEYKSGRSSVSPALAVKRVSTSLIARDPEPAAKQQILNQQIALAKVVELLSELLYHHEMGRFRNFRS